MHSFDVIIIGAGASGLFCAMEAGKRGRKILVLDHSAKPGRKILMAGGGKCNFTNLNVDAENYISHNSHFCKSALSRYTQWDFIDLINQNHISYEERDHGRLFTTSGSVDILNLLLSECHRRDVSIKMKIEVASVRKNADEFVVNTNSGEYRCRSVVVATGGLSIPGAGASPLGYEIARKFNMKVRPVRAGLVPLTLHPEDKARFSRLSGIAVDTIVSNHEHSFRENVLFTHRGLSGPAILQISSYLEPGEDIYINLLPDMEIENELESMRKERPLVKLKTLLSGYLPKRLIVTLAGEELAESPLKQISPAHCEKIARIFQSWKIKPAGTEGYRTAEVTSGGVDCDGVSSRTMESLSVPGLYFIGEVLDVTGQLGGYNLQWAWSSGWVAGQVV